MAQDEDYFVIIGSILIFCGIAIWRISFAFARYVEARNEERQRFCLLVAQELDRLDKAIKESEQARQTPEIVTPYKDLWQLRN